MVRTQNRTTRKRAATSGSVAGDAIEQAMSRLEELPEKPRENTSLRDAISQLQEPITIALDRGYSYEEVADILRDKGVRISTSSLRRYLAGAKRDTNGSEKPKRRRRSKRSADDDE